MSGKQANRIGLAIVLVLAIVVTGVYHGKLAGGLNTYLMGDFEDGLKNYYTFVYHVKHDSTWSHFNGMNYPHGEQLVFSDCQPWLANTTKAVATLFPGVANYGVGIINGSILLSLIASCLLLFLLLREYKLSVWVAVAGALAIGFLAPQISRMSGHYGLAHCFVIPLILLLSARFERGPTLKRSLGIALAIFLVSGLHFYYFALTGFFLTGWFFFRYVSTLKSTRQWLFVAKHWAIQVVLPFALLQAWLMATDGIADRPSSPFGFLIYKAQFESVFVALGYPLQALAASVMTIMPYEWEGIAYVGVCAGLFTLLLMLRVAFMAVRRRWTAIVQPFAEQHLNAGLLTAVVLLLFSFGYPFSFGLEPLLEYSGPLKQFRGIGRFAWVFYYVINVAGLVYLFRAVEAKSAVLRYAALAVPLLLMCYEAHERNSKLNYNFHTIPALQAGEAEWLANVHPEEFQAIVPIPYVHIGSENLGYSPSGFIKRDFMTASMLTGLPTTGVVMSRTSLSQTLENIRFAQRDFSGPLGDLSADQAQKPYLIIQRPQDQGLGADLQLFPHANSPGVLFWSDTLIVGSATPASLNLRYNQWASRQRDAAESGSYFDHGTVLANVPYEDFIYNGFDTLACARSFNGSPAVEDGDYGALESSMQGYTTLYRGTLPLYHANTPYHFSAWVYIGDDVHGLQRLVYEEMQPSGECTRYESLSLSNQLTDISDGWGLVEFTFHPSSADAKHLFHLQKDVLVDKRMWVDEVLIRPEGTNVFLKGDEGIELINNRLY